MIRRGRSISVLLVVLAVITSALASVQTWTAVSVPGVAEHIELTGSDVAPALPGTALGIGGIALAYLFAKRVLVYVVGTLLAILATVQLTVAMQGAADANPAVANAVALATGTTSTEGVELMHSGLGPSVAIAGAVLAAAAALFSLLTVHRWPVSQKRADKYDMRSGALAWDALDDGEDPTATDDDQQRRTD